MKPTLTSITAARIDGDVPSFWGIYVQNKSSVKLTINGAAGAYGSTIKSYSITGGGYSGSASTLTTGFLNNSGTITFKATVTDSRGRVSAEASVSITVTAYSPPYFNSSLSQRCLSNGTLDDDGTYIHALVSFGYSTCGGKNTLKTSVQYKQVSAEQWTDAGVTFAPILHSPMAGDRSLRRPPMMCATPWRMRFPPSPCRRSSPQLRGHGL